MLDLKKIKGLVDIIEKSSLMEFTYSDEECEITLSKLDNPPVIAGGAAAPISLPMPMAAPAAAPAMETKVEADDTAELITSPIVGTFYSSPSPEAPAFVRVGDKVKNGQTVCILEAMKLMNEIECEFDCEIEAILVSNEQKVEYGQPLFRVKRI